MAGQVVQIALVSEQSAPNLLAALDPSIPVSEVLMLVTEKMRKRADAIKSVLKQSGRGIDVRSVVLDDERDINRIQNTLYALIDELAGKTVQVNLTGGTKLMALAVNSCATVADWEQFYVDIDTDQIIWLHPKRPPQLLSQQLRLKHYLQGYGLSLAAPVERPQLSTEWAELTRTLVKEIGSLEVAIGKLNFLLHQQSEQSLVLRLNDSFFKDPNLDVLLRNFEQSCLLKLNGREVVFASEAARKFVHGGWIEHHVYQSARRVTGELGIRDVGLNVEVTAADGPKNEVDVMFLARNRLHTIECKTSRMDDPNDRKANNALYKIAENRRRIGGIGTRAMLASYRELSTTELRLADALNIKVVKSRELQRMDELLKVWIGQGN